MAARRNFVSSVKELDSEIEACDRRRYTHNPSRSGAAGAMSKIAWFRQLHLRPQMRIGHGVISVITTTRKHHMLLSVR